MRGDGLGWERTERGAVDAAQRFDVRLPHFREDLGAVLLQELDEVFELEQHILLQNLCRCWLGGNRGEGRDEDST